MQIDPNNAVVRLCAEGMALETEGAYDQARAMFQRAWEAATNDYEKFIAAHYVARLQDSVENKLRWDQLALELAQGIDPELVAGAFPSLYLNIAKAYEDLTNYPEAARHYELALSHCEALPEDEYGRMTRAGIANGIARIRAK